VGVSVGILFLRVVGAGTLLYVSRVMGVGAGVGFSSRVRVYIQCTYKNCARRHLYLGAINDDLYES